MGAAAKTRWTQGSAMVAVLLTVAAARSPQQLGAQSGYAKAELLVLGQHVAEQPAETTMRLIDVRAPEQYAAGHIPGAVNLPVATITGSRDGIPGMLVPIPTVEQALGARGITQKSWVVIYDAFGGVQATRLFWVLDYLGHPRVSVLQGGFEGWQQEGRPVTREVRQPQVSTYQATPDAAKLADFTWVRTHLQAPEVVLLDARSSAEFTGEVSGRHVKRPGHIPAAVNVDWVRNLTAPPRRFKTGKTLKQMYQDAGVTPENEIVVYCRTGARASHNYFVLRLLGYERVRLYDGSFVEWSNQRTVPVEP